MEQPRKFSKGDVVKLTRTDVTTKTVTVDNCSGYSDYCFYSEGILYHTKPCPLMARCGSTTEWQAEVISREVENWPPQENDLWRAGPEDTCRNTFLYVIGRFYKISLIYQSLVQTTEDYVKNNNPVLMSRVSKGYLIRAANLI